MFEGRDLKFERGHQNSNIKPQLSFSLTPLPPLPAHPTTRPGEGELRALRSPGDSFRARVPDCAAGLNPSATVHRWCGHGSPPLPGGGMDGLGEGVGG